MCMAAIPCRRRVGRQRAHAKALLRCATQRAQRGAHTLRCARAKMRACATRGSGEKVEKRRRQRAGRRRHGTDKARVRQRWQEARGNACRKRRKAKKQRHVAHRPLRCHAPNAIRASRRQTSTTQTTNRVHAAAGRQQRPSSNHPSEPSIQTITTNVQRSSSPLLFVHHKHSARARQRAWCGAQQWQKCANDVVC